MGAKFHISKMKVQVNKNILGLQLSQNWDVYSGRSTLKLMKLKLQGPLSRRSPWNNFF